MIWKILAVLSGLFGIVAGIVTVMFLIIAFNGYPKGFYSATVSATTAMICIGNATSWWQS